MLLFLFIIVGQECDYVCRGGHLGNNLAELILLVESGSLPLGDQTPGVRLVGQAFEPGWMRRSSFLELSSSCRRLPSAGIWITGHHAGYVVLRLEPRALC